MKIQLLDNNTINKIAAGEVVERPAAVVKELIENAIDAGANKIDIEIVDGGCSHIRVTDNGSGMTPDDAKLAILRHATSKISKVEDLSSLTTLGFRGEALPSIAAVSKFKLLTRKVDSDLGFCIEIDGGVVTDQIEAGAAPGTSIVVDQLFFNTPARKKFLKTTGTEGSYISEIVVKMALAHPEIGFKFTNNNKLSIQTTGTGILADALSSLYGAKIVENVLPLDYDCFGSIKVTGFVGDPTLLKSSRHWQTMLVNERIINNRMITKAIDNAYQSLLPKTGYPLVVLNLKIEPASIDVNVHPQKSEVKFSDEQTVYQAVYRAIRGALVAVNPAVHPVAQEQPAVSPVASFKGHTSIAQQPVQPQLIPFEPVQPISYPVEDVQRIDSTPKFDDYFIPLGQFKDCYIIAQGVDDVVFIDQHAAHERILYDRLCQKAEKIPSQQLLLPVFLNLSDEEWSTLEENYVMLHSLGFTLENAGPNLIKITECPCDIPISILENLLRDIFALCITGHKVQPQELRHSVLATTACRAAIKAGDKLSFDRMRSLIEELCNTAFPLTCPHGRPTIIKFTETDMAKMFKRI